MKDIAQLLALNSVIDCQTRSGAHFRHTFMGNYNKQFGGFPKIDSIIEEDGWYGLSLEGEDKVILSSCEGVPVMISDILLEPTEVNTLSFGYKFYTVPNIEGDNVFAFATVNGNLRGKIGNSYFINAPILDELGVTEKIKSVSQEYNCIVFGVVEDRQFIATEMMDIGNNCVYAKAITDQIFSSYGLNYQETIEQSKVHEALSEHGAVVVKIYNEGKIHRFCKKTGVSRSKLQAEIFNLLFDNIAMVSTLGENEIYGFINKGGGGYYKYDKDIIMKIITGWKKKLKEASAEELYNMLKK